MSLISTTELQLLPESTLQEARAWLIEHGLDLAHVDCQPHPKHLYLADVIHMLDMGLGHLPVTSIALVPEQGTPYRGGTGLSDRMVDAPDPYSFDVSHRLTEFFPSFFVAALYEFQSLLNKAALEAYVVGGIARDLLLVESKRLDVEDVDVTVRGDAIACAKYLSEHSKNFEVLDTFPEFGTAKVSYKHKIHFDLASTRRETYERCGSLPAVLERGVPLEVDIARRDFTVNTLTLSLHDLGQVFDITAGIQDIENRLLRVLHPASFFEDPSRILRALKFAIRLDFELAPGTRALIESFFTYAAQAGYRGGGARIKEAFKSLFALPESPQKQRWLTSFLHMGGIRLSHIPYWEAHPLSLEELETVSTSWCWAAKRLPILEGTLEKYLSTKLSAVDRTWRVYLSLMFVSLQSFSQEDFLMVFQQLGLTREERNAVEKFQVFFQKHLLGQVPICCEEDPDLGSPVSSLTPQSWLQEDNLSKERIYHLFNPLPESAALAAVILAHPFPKALDILQLFLSKLSHISVELNGKELMVLGVPEGEAVGNMRETLLMGRLAGTIQSRTDEVRYVETSLGLPLKEALTLSNEKGEKGESHSADTNLSVIPTTKRIGLTGGIASGKSLVGEYLDQLGIPVIDADEVVHHLLKTDTELHQKIRDHFGVEVFHPGGTVDRKRLGDQIFQNPGDRQLLESWIHPKVREKIDHFMVAAEDQPVAVAMIPLLFESGLEQYYDETWLVVATQEQQIQRLKDHRGLDRQAALLRIQSQLPLEEKKAWADVLIDNTKDVATTYQQVDQRLAILQQG